MALLAGRYRLERTVGTGGMGTVWRAHDQQLGRDVAIKELILPVRIEPDERRLLCDRASREARAAARLRHPGVITIHDVIEHEDGSPWIVMELIEGRSLEELIDEAGRLPPPQVAEIGIRLLAALRAAHAKGVTHRDIKPSNVLLEGDRVILTDFGIAGIDGDPTLTRAGVMIGTPAYMAPEQARGKRGTPMSDLWSLGATLYKAVEGAPPFGGPNPGAVFMALASEDPRPTRYAGPLERLLSGLLEKDPEDRFTAEEADRLLHEAREADPDQGWREPHERPTRRHSTNGDAATTSSDTVGDDRLDDEELSLPLFHYSRRWRLRYVSRSLRSQATWRIGANAAALLVGILFTGISLTTASLPQKVGVLFIAAALFGLANAVIRPIVRRLGCTFRLLTIGLSGLAANMALLLVAGHVASQTHWSFHASGFWAVLWGGLTIGVANWLVTLYLDTR
jgi:serine/threonine protein kinase